MQQPVTYTPRTVLALALILLFGLALRLLLFTGFFGSDEVTYLAVALPISQGEWPVSTYIGSLRYGANIPTAMAIRWFGMSEFSANLWSLLCSLGEIALVFVMAHAVWGRHAAVLAALLLATLPLHVNIAGRLSADAPLGFFIAASFVLFYLAERRGSRLLFLLAGVAVGGVFWIKEVTTVFVAIFGVYALLQRRWDWRWSLAAAGALAMLALNCTLMWRLTGDPFYIFRTVSGRVSLYVHEFTPESSPGYYFRYLFLDVKHTWLLGYASAAALLVWLHGRSDRSPRGEGSNYVVLWAVGMLALFSLMPISFDPFMLIAKQSNYVLMFAAPLCLLAGWWISRQRPVFMRGLAVAWLAGAIPLAALEQQAVHVFTANSKATVAYAAAHPERQVYALSNGFRAGMYNAMIEGGSSTDTLVRDMAELLDPGAAAPSGPPALAVVDTETLGWQAEALTRLAQVPECWRRVDTLEPTGYGLGRRVAEAGAAVAHASSGVVPGGVAARFDALVSPRPAYVYEVPHDCRRLAGGSDAGG